MTYPDERRLYAAIYLHDSKLYILEATVPPRTPPPGMFQQSVGFVDDQGERIRYDDFADAPKVRDAPNTEERQRLRELTRQVFFKPPPRLSLAQRGQIQPLFADEIEQLQVLLGRDLSAWLV